MGYVTKFSIYMGVYMDFDFQLLMIILFFTFFAGIVDSIAGGGGIISISGYLLAGVPIHNAMATSKVSAVFGQSVAAYNYLKEKHYNREFVLFSVIGGVLGGLIGARFALMLNPKDLEIIVMISLPIAAIVILNKKQAKHHLSRQPRYMIRIITFSIGLLLGVYGGLIGPGTGTFLIIAFTYCGLSFLQANGNAKIVNTAMDIAAMILYFNAGKTIIWLAIPAVVVGMLANYIGSKLAIKNGEKIIKPMIYFVLCLLFVNFIYNFFN